MSFLCFFFVFLIIQSVFGKKPYNRIPKYFFSCFFKAASVCNQLSHMIG